MAPCFSRYVLRIIIPNLERKSKIADDVSWVVSNQRGGLAVCGTRNFLGGFRVCSRFGFRLNASVLLLSAFLGPQEDGSSFEEGMLKLLRTLPKVLKYLPSDKAKDARNFMMSFQVSFWSDSRDGRDASTAPSLFLSRCCFPPLSGVGRHRPKSMPLLMCPSRGPLNDPHLQRTAIPFSRNTSRLHPSRDCVKSPPTLSPLFFFHTTSRTNLPHPASICEASFSQLVSRLRLVPGLPPRLFASAPRSTGWAAPPRMSRACCSRSPTRTCRR